MKMLNKEECYIALNDMYDCTLTGKADCKTNREILSNLIKEHFELVEEYKKLETSDASKEECTIEQHGEIKRLRSEFKQLQDEVDRYQLEYYSMCDLLENQ